LDADNDDEMVTAGEEQSQSSRLAHCENAYGLDILLDVNVIHPTI
jgi:hypothetical protein